LREISPQLRALGPDMRLLAVFIDAVAAYGEYCPQVQARVDSAMLAERADGEGWHEDAAQRTLRARGWKDADAIYNAAGIPEKHRPVIDLALYGNPARRGRGHRREDEEGGFSDAEIARLTGHPTRTVQLWLHDDLPKLFSLDDWEVAV
jgi:hypothetical protein